MCGRRCVTAKPGLMLALVAVLLLLAGCSLQRERSFKVAEDWSRGQLVGFASIRQPVGLDADSQGAYLLWSARKEEGTRLDYARLTPDGSLAISTTLPLNTVFPRLPQVVAGPDLQAFLVTRFSSDEQAGVYHFMLDRDGALLSSPERLSAPEQVSDIVAVAPAPDGVVHVLWDVIDGPGQGVYHVQIAPDGTQVGFPQLVGPSGLEPAAQVGADGTLHAAWLLPVSSGRLEVLYARLEPGARLLSDPVTVSEQRVATSDVALPLSLGADDSHVYVMWSQEHRSGLQAGTAELFYVAFPQDQPAMRSPTVPLLPSDPDPAYYETDQFPPLTEVARLEDSSDWTSYTEAPMAFRDDFDTSALKVLADLTYSFRFDPRPQLVLALFDDGDLTAYQQPALTRQYAQRPRGVATEDEHLHITWINLEDPGRYSIYYASTAPAVSANLDQRTANDLVLDTIDTLWGMVSGISLIPLVGVVLIPLLLINGIFYLTGNDDSLKTSWAARLTLVVSIIVYLGTKMLVMAGVVTRPPLQNVVPASIQPMWTWLAFLVVAALAGLVLWVYIRRHDRPFLFRAVLTFALADAIITLLLYGPTFYGE